MIAGKDWLFVGNPKAASTTLRHAFIHDLQGETLYTQHIPYITCLFRGMALDVDLEDLDIERIEE